MSCSDTFKLPPTDEFVKKVVCQENDIEEGCMLEVCLDEENAAKKCLLTKRHGVIRAVSSKCTHFGAPLSKGAFSVKTGLIRCPWHGACFSSETGDIEDYPGLDSLLRFDVDISQDGAVSVLFRRSDLTNIPKRQLKMVAADKGQQPVVVVVGGGGATSSFVETLRQCHVGFTGRIIMITNETILPYNRPCISKSLSSLGTSLLLRSESFYDQANIEVMNSTQVTAIDTDAQNVLVSDDQRRIHYDHLVLATGSEPRRLNSLPGSDLGNIFVLRRPEDGNKIATHIAGSLDECTNVVIIGASFIGMEVAACLMSQIKSKTGSSVTVIGSGDVPYQRSLGKQVGLYLMEMHLERGVKFIMGSRPVGFGSSGAGNSQNVGYVTLANGQNVPADICVLGVGAEPCTDFIRSSSIRLNDRGFVRVDENMRTNIKNIYALGDIVEFPLGYRESRVSVGHWQMALSHGRCAAFAIGGKPYPLRSIPFFWTVQYGKSVRYAGYWDETGNLDDVIVVGNAKEFVAYYCEDEFVVAMASLNKDPMVAQFANDLLDDKQILRTSIKL